MMKNQLTALSGASHDDVDVAGAASTDEGLLTIEHVVVSVLGRRRLQRRSVRAGSRLREAVRRELLLSIG
jgi:hypothetical protein